MERKDFDLPPAGDVRFENTGPDPALASAVDEALIGDVLADLPEAQPNRTLKSAADFSSLYVRHRSGLAAHARRFLRDPRDVDEVVQETFLRLFLAISEIETEIQAIAFARRTLTNLCIDRYRAERRRPTLITLDASALYDVTGDDDLPDPVLQAEDAAIVREALARLSPLHRAALVKREIEEKALPQIAAELGVAEDSVKHLLFRARRALRRLLIGTSVEPGVDLNGDESTGPSLLRGATVFILFLVGALVVASGIRPLLSGGGKATPSVEGAGVGAGVPGIGPLPPRGVVNGLGHHARHHKQAAHRDATVAPVSTGSSSGVRNTHPAAPPVKSVRPTRHPSTFGAARGHFKLRGPLKATGTPQVSEGGVSNDGNGNALAASSFTAPTDHGTFELNQSISTSGSGASTVTVTPAFVVGSHVEMPDLTGSSAAVGTDSAGNVTVDVIAGTQPDSSGNPVGLTSVGAQLVLTPDLTRVLTETVTLSTQPAAQQAPVSAGGTTPPAGGPGGSGSTQTTGPGQPGSDNGPQTGTPSGCTSGGTGTSTQPSGGAATCQPSDTATTDTTSSPQPTSANAKAAW